MWCGTEEAAEYLGCHVRTLRRLIACGELRAIRHEHSWKVFFHDLEEFARLHKGYLESLRKDSGKNKRRARAAAATRKARREQYLSLPEEVLERRLLKRRQWEEARKKRRIPNGP